MKTPHHPKGVTLIELSVTISLILILISVLFVRRLITAPRLIELFALPISVRYRKQFAATKTLNL